MLIDLNLLQCLPPQYSQSSSVSRITGIHLTNHFSLKKGEKKEKHENSNSLLYRVSCLIKTLDQIP